MRPNGPEPTLVVYDEAAALPPAVERAVLATLYGFGATELRWEPWPQELRDYYGPCFDAEEMGA